MKIIIKFKRKTKARKQYTIDKFNAGFRTISYSTIMEELSMWKNDQHFTVPLKLIHKFTTYV